MLSDYLPSDPTAPSGDRPSGASGPNSSKDANSATKEKLLTLSTSEKKSLESTANLVSIIKAVEALEKQYVNGRILNDDYEKACNSLINQFKVQQTSLKVNLKYGEGNFGQFWKDYRLDQECPLAAERLRRWGVPASMLYNSTNDKSTKQDDSLFVFDACQGIMTLTDSLRMNLRACDEILPVLKEIIGSVTKIPDLSLEKLQAQISEMQSSGNVNSTLTDLLEYKRRVTVEWLQTLNGMQAEETLSEGQARQFALDVETFYSALHGWLRERNQGRGGK